MCLPMDSKAWKDALENSDEPRGVLTSTGTCSHPPALPPSHNMASQGRTEYLSGDWCGGVGERRTLDPLLRLQTEGTVV